MRAVVFVAALAAVVADIRPRRQEAGTTAEGRFFTLAGGDVGGNYFAVARAICREINRTSAPPWRCSPEADAGFVYNLVGLRSGELDFAIVQSDWLASARGGTGRFRRDRAICRPARCRGTLPGGDHPDRCGRLWGCRNRGPFGTARRHRPTDIRASCNGGPYLCRHAVRSWQPWHIVRTARSRGVDELCGGRLDAIFLVVGHPDATVARGWTNAEHASCRWSGRTRTKPFGT